MHALRTPARSLLAAVGLTAVLALSACGSDDADASGTPTTDHAASVTVTDPWIRATEGSEDTSMTAAFMLLENEADAEATLVGAATEVAGRTEVHEMIEKDGEMLMQAIEGGLVLAPGRGQVLQPGGTHIMLMDVSTELKAGDEVALTLEFDDGSTQELTVPVKPFTEETGHYHAPGTDEDHEH
jgi:copper(I)-binding protein